MLTIRTNVKALSSHRALSSIGVRRARSMERLSTGLRINRAADDAAGLAISERMRAQIRGLDQAVRNAQDGISLIQTAEGAMQEIQDMAQRMRELVVQYKNGTLDSNDRSAIRDEINALTQEIDQITGRTSFNNRPLLDSTHNVINIQNGASAGQSIQITLPDVGGLGHLDLNNNDALDVMDAFLRDVSAARATLGATQNRLEHSINNLITTAENTRASESRIRDVDMAREMMELTRLNILQQAAMAMLAQANQAPQSILQLLA